MPQVWPSASMGSGLRFSELSRRYPAIDLAASLRKREHLTPSTASGFQQLGIPPALWLETSVQVHLRDHECSHGAVALDSCLAAEPSPVPHVVGELLRVDVGQVL